MARRRRAASTRARTSWSARSSPRPPGLRAAPRTWNRDSIVTALHTWAAEHGRPPRSYEWAPASGRAGGLVGPEPVRYELEHPRWPSTVMVAEHFGSWSDALRAAGLPARITERELPRAAASKPPNASMPQAKRSARSPT